MCVAEPPANVRRMAPLRQPGISQENCMLGFRSTGPAGLPSRRSRTTLSARVLVLALSILMLPPAAAASSPYCTAEQGQAFIDAGQLGQAVHELSCVIDHEPTDVEGYRGRAE